MWKKQYRWNTQACVKLIIIIKKEEIKATSIVAALTAAMDVVFTRWNRPTTPSKKKERKEKVISIVTVSKAAMDVVFIRWNRPTTSVSCY